MTHPEQFAVDTEPIPLVDTVAEFTHYGEELISGIRQVAKSGKFILGPQVKELETTLEAFVQNEDKELGKVQCIGVSDGTTALQMCLMALGIGEGHEVITVPFTWISTAEVIPLVGASPIFVDIEPDSYVMDAEKVAQAISANTRAVITVSLYGVIPDLRRIRQVLDEAQEKFGTDIALIEDGAQSFGSIRQGYRSCGSPHATLSTTSFFPTKPLSCYGDGGAVFTRDEKLADRLRAIRVHGKVKGSHVMVGLNARLDTLQAAVLLTKFSFFEESLSARQKVAEAYLKLLREDERIVLPSYTRITNDDGMKSAYGVYTIQVQQRDEVVKRMKQADIGCAIYYSKCCHKQPVFASAQELSVSESMSQKVLSLPIHPYLNVKQQRRIVQVLRTILDDLGVAQRPE
ncbi:Pyridoxal phosphate-dependent transferase [Gracilaria domingensis]|nr:Pyridoxal phosphate-dependent transferase [Gracilaria domingensis]